MKSAVIVKNPSPGEYEMQCQECEWHPHYRLLTNARARETAVNHSKRHLLRAIFAKKMKAALAVTNRAEGN